MPWTSQTISMEVDIDDVLAQLPEEAIVEYLKSMGYEVKK